MQPAVADRVHSWTVPASTATTGGGPAGIRIGPWWVAPRRGAPGRAGVVVGGGPREGGRRSRRRSWFSRQRETRSVQEMPSARRPHEIAAHLPARREPESRQQGGFGLSSGAKASRAGSKALQGYQGLRRPGAADQARAHDRFVGEPDAPEP